MVEEEKIGWLKGNIVGKSHNFNLMEFLKENFIMWYGFHENAISRR